MLGREFILEVRERCTNILTNIGMKHQRRGNVILNLTKDIQGSVGLNCATHQSPIAMYVNPFIGIRYHPIHKLSAEITGEKYHRYHPPTIAKNLGYLMPEYRFKSYEFIKGEEIQPVAQEMADDVEKYALPFMHNNASFEAIVKLIPKLATMNEAKYEYLLMAYHLMGKRESEINRFIEKTINEGKKKMHFYWEGFEELSNKYKVYIAGH